MSEHEDAMTLARELLAMYAVEDARWHEMTVVLSGRATSNALRLARALLASEKRTEVARASACDEHEQSARAEERERVLAAVEDTLTTAALFRAADAALLMAAVRARLGATKEAIPSGDTSASVVPVTSAKLTPEDAVWLGILEHEPNVTREELEAGGFPARIIEAFFAASRHTKP